MLLPMLMSRTGSIRGVELVLRTDLTTSSLLPFQSIIFSHVKCFCSIWWVVATSSPSNSSQKGQFTVTTLDATSPPPDEARGGESNSGMKSAKLLGGGHSGNSSSYLTSVYLFENLEDDAAGPALPAAAGALLAVGTLPSPIRCTRPTWPS